MFPDCENIRKSRSFIKMTSLSLGLVVFTYFMGPGVQCCCWALLNFRWVVNNGQSLVSVFLSTETIRCGHVISIDYVLTSYRSNT